jgi:hypothetical protein
MGGDVMTWWLSVFFFVNGTWVPGTQVNGWDPRPFPSEAACLERKAFAEKECRDHPLDFEAFWMCTKGAPAREPPKSPPGVEC